MSDIKKEFFKEVRKEIITFSFDAFKSGAANVGKELVNVTSDENRNERQPSSLQFGMFTNALKTGIMGTGQELMVIGLERIKARFPQE